MNFVTKPPILANWNKKSYNSIQIIINCLSEIVYYTPVKVIIDVPVLAKVIINIIMHYHGILDLIVTYQSLLFILKFLFLLCYFLGINQKLFTTF